MSRLDSRLDEFPSRQRLIGPRSRVLGGTEGSAPRADGESRWNGFSNATIHIISTGKYRRTVVTLELCTTT